LKKAIKLYGNDIDEIRKDKTQWIKLKYK
jgi:hypothetical protein